MRETIDSFQRVAIAEKEMCEVLGPRIAAMVRAIEKKAGVPVNEIRIVASHEGRARWITANCTLLS